MNSLAEAEDIAVTPLIDSHLLEPAEHRRIRLATSVMFLVDGIGFGVWATLLPTFKERFCLTDEGLSNGMLGMVFGAMFGMPMAGRAISRWGSGPVIRWLSPVYCMFLVVLVASPTWWALIAAATVFGMMKGAFDVSVNSQAIAVENAGSRRIMSGFQALWSIGGGLAAVGTGMALKHDVAPMTLVVAINVLLLAGALSQGGRLLSTDSFQPAAGEPVSSRPSRRVIQIGLLALLVLFAEGVMMDWSSVYSRDVAHAPDWLAPFAFGVFSTAMALGRLSGDWILARVDSRQVLRWGAVLNAVGMLVVISIHSWPVVFAGLAICGFGLSNQVTIIFSAGGRAHAGGVARGVALVSTIGYFGFMAGPPVIGRIGHLIGLPAAFSIVLAFAAVLAICGPRTLGQESR